MKVCARRKEREGTEARTERDEGALLNRGRTRVARQGAATVCSSEPQAAGQRSCTSCRVHAACALMHGGRHGGNAQPRQSSVQFDSCRLKKAVVLVHP